MRIIKLCDLFFKLAGGGQNIIINIDDYKQSLIAEVNKVLEFTKDEIEKAKEAPLDINNIISKLKEHNYENVDAVEQALRANDIDAIDDCVSFYYSNKPKRELFLLFSDIEMYNRQIKINNGDYVEYNEEQAKEDIEKIANKTIANMEIIKTKISNAIDNINNWNNSTVIIECKTIEKENDFTEPETSATIYVGNSIDTSPLFSYLDIGDGKIIIDDVFEAGDSDSFQNLQEQSDYFNLISELRNPGSTSKSKIITVYTARPIKDRSQYINATTIPSNLFFSSSLSAVEGIAIELAGVDSKIRDVWRVRIDKKYLVETMNTPTEKQYQAVSDKPIPVVKMELLSLGE